MYHRGIISTFPVVSGIPGTFSRTKSNYKSIATEFMPMFMDPVGVQAPPDPDPVLDPPLDPDPGQDLLCTRRSQETTMITMKGVVLVPHLLSVKEEDLEGGVAFTDIMEAVEVVEASKEDIMEGVAVTKTTIMTVDPMDLAMIIDKTVEVNKGAVTLAITVRIFSGLQQSAKRIC